jgi:hypothetical protein
MTFHTINFVTYIFQNIKQNHNHTIVTKIPFGVKNVHIAKEVIMIVFIISYCLYSLSVLFTIRVV